MSNEQRFSDLYKSVGAEVSDALLALADVEVSSDKANRHLDKMRADLRAMQAQFAGEIAYLEEHAEWDQFSIAFFGETNAGKSTLIESLRIVFDERARRDRVQRRTEELSTAQDEIWRDADRLTAAVGHQFRIYAEEVAQLRRDVVSLVRDEAAARSQSAERTAAAARGAALRLVLASLAGVAAGIVIGLLIHAARG